MLPIFKWRIIMNYGKEMNKTNVEFGDLPPQAFLLGLLSAFDNRYQAAADVYLKEITWKLQKKGISVSLFINPDIKQIKFAKETGADFIELHTGRYADAKNSNAVKKEFLSIKKSAYFAHSIGLNINAGHGLNYKNVLRIAKIPVIIVCNKLYILIYS